MVAGLLGGPCLWEEFRIINGEGRRDQIFMFVSAVPGSWVGKEAVGCDSSVSPLVAALLLSFALPCLGGPWTQEVAPPTPPPRRPVRGPHVAVLDGL